MSIEAIAIALHHTRAKSATSKLVLLGIANHDGDGGAWPSVATLSLYAKCSPRTVQRSVDELERLGEIRRIVQAGGLRHHADHRRPNLYEVLLRCPPDCDRSKNHRTRNQPGPMVDLEGLQDEIGDDGVIHTGDTGVTRTDIRSGGKVSPDSSTGVTPMSPEPLPTPQIKRESQPQYTRERSSWDHVCIDGTMDHAVSRRTNACAYCGARRLRWTEEQ